ncbi:MAG: FCD domain-containing protein, partial [Pseudomonadota bacterium]
WKMRTELEPVREVHAAICAKEDARNRDAEHADIVEALKERDPAAARTAMQRHFRHLLESMIDITEAQAMAELRQRATESRERYLKRAPN